MAALASVVIRAKDEAASIGRTLDLLAAQRPPGGRDVEVIVVDSGSVDGTPVIARERGARVIAIPAQRFTYGGALNVGCAAARGDVIVALSAHAFPTDDGWLARLVEPLDADPSVAATSGGGADPDGAPLTSRVVQDAAHARAHPFWGYTNSEGAFRAELWRALPFRWDMPGTEDKAWARHWLERGRRVVIDPAFSTAHDHSDDPLREQYARHRREWRGYAMFLDVPPYGLRALALEWWTERGAWPASWRARLSPVRLTRLAGKHAGLRRRDRAPLEIAVVCDTWPELSQTFIANEAEALRRQGHAVTVEARWHARRAMASPPPVPPRFASEETRAERLSATAWLVARHPLRALDDLRSRRRWRRDERVVALRRLAVRARRLSRRPQVHLHAHFADEAALDALRLGALLGAPTSLTAHAYEIYAAPSNLREKLLRARFATSGCDYTVGDLRALVGPEHAGAVFKVVMGVDPAAFRRRTPLPGSRRVVAVGRLVEKKGFVHLVRAAAALDDGSEVIIAGNGPLRADLERAAARLGAPVTFLGDVEPDAVRALLESADVLCMPCVVAADGDRDSMPVVVKEAMAMELLVVATDEVGLPEIVREPWGRLVAPGDDAALARALNEVLALGREQRASAGRAARAHVERWCHVGEESAKLATLIRAARHGRA